MLKSLFRRRPAPEPQVPSGERVYAVGDVHGCADAFDRLLAAIREDDLARGRARTTLVLLGDLVDRGPDSRWVVERALGLGGAFEQAVLLKGNHEEILLEAAKGDRYFLQMFDRVGGRETMLSYGVDPQTYDDASLEELGKLILRHVPASHRIFLDQAQDHVTVGDYLFVHAGIRPGVALEEQKSTDLRWIREPFLSHRGAHPWMVVHGHTITPQVEIKSNRIGIDTGAYVGGPLTAIGLEGEERWFLTT